MNVIAERLREQREKVNYSQSAFVAEGVKQTTLSQWEGGDTPAALESLAILARRYGCSADYLLGLTDDPAPYEERTMPLYGAEILEVLRDLPEDRQEEIWRIVQIIHERELQQQDRRLQQILDYLEEQVDSATFDKILEDRLDSTASASTELHVVKRLREAITLARTRLKEQLSE